ncbi:putative F-box/LRR-repeat protein At5g02700 [Syzygium oleosum]|uniref:putative F-box/LRR-repeat protein At5g02700 n=1 Tax=Syzygium oleosum TaxID=219896 RepID=UPI0024BAAE63|nr:putative F-box/LRR-repeat protein At5g02700 [Syzygium oleosum]
MTLVASPRSSTLTRGLREWPREGRGAGEGSRVRADQWRVCGNKEQARRAALAPPRTRTMAEDRRRRFGGIVFAMDYISQLSDDLILHIFSFLDHKRIHQNQCIVQAWHSTWTSNPYITLSLPAGSRRKNFIAFMDKVLLSCTAINVKRFLFDAPFHASMQSSIDRWLHFAVRHDLEEVSMTLHSWRFDIYALPQFLFLCTTLASFHVSRCCFSMIGAVNCSSLKRLHIEHAELREDVMMRVLSGSPVLEFLELKCCWGFMHIMIESRGLRELVIDSHEFRRVHNQILRISAPHLLKLHQLGDFWGGEFELDGVSSLVEAELNFNVEIFTINHFKAHGDLVKGLLQRLHHVTKLVMGSLHLQVLSLMEAKEVFLPSLECRHLKFLVAADHEGVPGIAKILESSPHLEKLFLQMTCTPSAVTRFIVENVARRDFDAEEFRNSAKWRINLCPTHLKHVEIVDPSADLMAWEPVLSMLKFLLQNAPCLDEILINSANSKSSKVIDPWGLLEVAQTILSHPKCSPTVKVILKYPSQGCPSKRAGKS